MFLEVRGSPCGHFSVTLWKLFDLKYDIINKRSIKLLMAQ